MKKSIFVASLFAAAVFCGTFVYAENSEMKTENNYASIQLSNGLKIPQFGLGTYRSSEQQAHDAVLEALKDGYRHIDTAHARTETSAELQRQSRKVEFLARKSGLPQSFGLRITAMETERSQSTRCLSGSERITWIWFIFISLLATTWQATVHLKKLCAREKSGQSGFQILT